METRTGLGRSYLGESKTTVFEVRDPKGKLMAVHRRRDTDEGKQMWWERPDGESGLNGTSLTDLPLYGAHRVGGWSPDDLIVLTEGEKAAQVLLDAGLKAVGTVTGASGTPGAESLEVLRDRRVVLWPDNDEPGYGHMRRIAEGLQDLAVEILIYNWDDAPAKGDAADHPLVLRQHPGGVDRLLTDLESAPRWRPPSECVTDAQVAGNGKPATFTAAELMATVLPPPKWAVPDLIPEGVILLAGKPKLGKSWLALGLGVAVSTGGVALGTKSVRRGDVLYLALEDNQRRLQTRLGLLLAGGRAPEKLHMALGWPRLDGGGAEKLADWLEEHPDARLVVVDTLKKIRPRTSANRSLYEMDYEALEPLLPIAAEYGVGIVVVHHTRKADADDPLDTISGSTGLTGGVDGTMVLKRERGRADAYLHIAGRDIEEDTELALKWDPETVGWRIVGDAEEYRLSEERAEIVRVLEERDEPMTPTEVADVLDKKTNTVKQRMWRMGKDGQLDKSDGGYSVSNRNPRNSITEKQNGYAVTGVTGYEDIH